MKKNRLYTLFIGITLLATIIGCKEEYTPIGNRLYISEAASEAAKKVSVSVGVNTQTSFTVRTGDKVSQDLHATLVIDPSILDEYNEKNKTSYTVLPDENLKWDKNIVIPSGKAEAEPTSVVITPYSAEEGVRYAIPVRVVGDGSIAEEKVFSKYILLLDKPWVQSTPYMKTKSKDNSFVCEPIDTEWNLPLDNFTVEFWFWMNGFDVNNQSVIDCDAFYIRLGNTQMITSAQMQINIWTVGGSNNKCYLTAFTFQKNTWTHVAISYDSEASKCIFYINGSKAGESDATGGAAKPLQKFAFATTDNGYSRNDRMMGQLRLWNKVLSQAEIQANMSGPMAVHPNMVGYWKMDEGQGNILYDATDNKHHAKPKTDGGFEWRADQCFMP